MACGVCELGTWAESVPGKRGRIESGKSISKQNEGWQVVACHPCPWVDLDLRLDPPHLIACAQPYSSSASATSPAHARASAMALTTSDEPLRASPQA